jgi:flagellar biosynthesis component FlhA
VPAPPGPAGRTLWEEGHEPGRQVVALAAALALSGVVVDLTLGGDLGLLFDLAFVGLCVAVALLVRPRDFFTVGVLPPLLMLAVLVLLELARPAVLGEPQDGAVQSVVTGLAHHAGALVVGYLLCLAVLAVRHRFVTRGRERQAANLPGSPAPTRTTSG